MSTIRDQKYFEHLKGITTATDSVFRYIFATHEGKDIRLSWQLQPSAPSIQDDKFEIYRNHNFGHEDSWQKIAEVIDDWTFLDTTVTFQTKTFRNLAYRIRVLIPEEHYSPPILIFPHLTERERLIARALLRRKLITQKSLPHFEGYLFKRLWQGTPCSCADTLTGEPTNSDCPICFGTGITTGYWRNPKPLILNVAGPFTAAILFDYQNLFLGTSEPQQTEAIVPAIYPVDLGDVWVPKTHFPRFYVVQTIVESEFKGIPIGYRLVLRQASRSDVIYSLQIP